MLRDFLLLLRQEAASPTNQLPNIRCRTITEVFHFGVRAPLDTSLLALFSRKLPTNIPVCPTSEVVSSRSTV